MNEVSPQLEDCACVLQANQGTESPKVWSIAPVRVLNQEVVSGLEIFRAPSPQPFVMPFAARMTNALVVANVDEVEKRGYSALTSPALRLLLHTLSALASTRSATASPMPFISVVFWLVSFSFYNSEDYS